MTAPITLPPLDTATLAELRRLYEVTSNVESRTRYQVLLLAQQDYKVPQIARIVLRSEYTVARELKRFVVGGLDVVPRRSPPGRERRVTAAWEAELLRVIELDPHEVGVRRWSQLPADVPHLLALLPRADLSTCRMKCNLPFTPP